MPARTQSADAYIFGEERDQFEGPPTQEDRLVSKILNVIRRTNITVSPPAHIAPTYWTQPIDLSARVNVAAAVGAYATAITYTVPEGYGGRIDGYGVTVQDAAYNYNGSLLWRLQINGRDIENLTDWGEQRGSVVIPRETVIILQEQDTIRLQVRRAVGAAGAQDVDHALKGWIWRKRMNYEGTAASVTQF